jgi:hypothetical protein
MWEFGINRNSDDFTTDFAEFFSLIIEGNDLSGAYESKVERIEEKNNVFAVIGLDVNVDKVILEPCRGIEVWGGFSDERHILT